MCCATVRLIPVIPNQSQTEAAAEDLSRHTAVYHLVRVDRRFAEQAAAVRVFSNILHHLLLLLLQLLVLGKC